MSFRLDRGVSDGSIQDPDCKGGLTIFLSQNPESLAHWRFTVKARTDEGLFNVGTFCTSLPVNTTGPINRTTPGRVVAIANCPGAKDWTVSVSRAEEEIDSDPPDWPEVCLAVGESIGPPGLVRVAERYTHYSGVAGAIQLLPGDRVVGWSAVAGAPGATLTIEALPVIVIPPNATAAGSTGGNLEGPATMTFAGTLAYLVEIARSS